MVLVTGGTGFLGAHLICNLLKQDFEVRSLIRETSSMDLFNRVASFYGKEVLLLVGKINWVKGDISDIFSIHEALQDISEVYHCAAEVSFDIKKKVQLYKTNVIGTANIVNVCIESGISRLCYVSSIGALGSSETSEETDELSPRKKSSHQSAYSESKYLAELEVWRGIAEGLNAVIVNPSVIIGPGSFEDGFGKLLKLINNGLKYYPSGTNAWVDVRDVATTMIKLMKLQEHEERYIVSAENISYRTIFEMIANHLQKTPPQRKASKSLMNFVMFLAALRKIISGKQNPLSREIIRISSGQSFYSSKKLITKTGINFIPVAASVSDACIFYTHQIGTDTHIEE